jgi:hypothetical protein
VVGQRKTAPAKVVPTRSNPVSEEHKRFKREQNNLSRLAISMKAYRLTWPNSDRSIIAELGYAHHLPMLICEVCEPQFKRWGAGYEYPAFKFDFLRDPVFNHNSIKQVNIDEFDQIKSRILGAVGRPVMIFPFSGIGLLAGKTSTTKLEDFMWGRIHFPQISRRAKDILADEGINLLTTEMSMTCRGRKVDSHLAMQVEPADVLTEETFAKLSITRCQRCGRYVSRQMYGPRDRFPSLEIKRAALPPVTDLVMPIGGRGIIASERFIAAAEKHCLTGLRFEECGSYV